MGCGGGRLRRPHRCGRATDRHLSRLYRRLYEQHQATVASRVTWRAIDRCTSFACSEYRATRTKDVPILRGMAARARALRRALLPLAVAVFGAATVAGCSGSDATQAASTPARPIGISISPDGQTIAPGETVQLAATLRYTDGSVRDVTSKARWRSSKATFVGVNQKGVATAQAAGSATITATANGRSASVRIAVGSPSMGPLTTSRANSRYFEDADGKIVYLAGLHTWANLIDSGGKDPPRRFDYEKFLDFLQSHDLNVVRLWAWEQARWTAETEGDYWFSPTVYERVGPELGLDGKPKFDLTKFNPEYFDRLRERVLQARERGIYAIVMLFDGWSVESKGPALNNPWRGHPFNGDNNINGIDGDPAGDDNGIETHTLEVSEVTRLQEDYVRRVIDAVGDQPNVLYEISNESPHNISADWQDHMAGVIRDYEQGRPMQHPIGITHLGDDIDVLYSSTADWIAPRASIDDPIVGDGRKVVVYDTDHLCGVCGDESFPWKAMTRGLNPLFMDIYDGAAYGLGAADGDPNNPDWEKLRRALGATRIVAERLDLARMTPQVDVCSTGYCLADASAKGAYLVYLPDGGSVTVDLSDTPGTLHVEWIRPLSGATVRRETVQGGDSRNLEAPFDGPAVVLVHAPAR
jgi:Bacterial Ig-like domain (group 2)/Family of unknown function (DUF6298)